MISISPSRLSVGGFTFIELLVVVSIISLFASIFIASFNSTRGKAKDGMVQNYMAQLRTVAENNHLAGVYSSVTFQRVPYESGITPPDCVIQTGFEAIESNLVKLDQNIRVMQGVDCATTNAEKGINIIKQTGAGADTRYFAYARLPSTENFTGIARAWWCIDSSGNSKKVTNLGGTSIPPAPPNDVTALCP